MTNGKSGNSKASVNKRDASKSIPTKSIPTKDIGIKDSSVKHTAPETIAAGLDGKAAVDPGLVRAKINGETGQIAWRDLQRFFASGRAIAVDPGLNLLDMALAFAKDHHEQVGLWLAAGTVARVSDEQALDWYATNARMWSVVVSPWVLVQPVVGVKTADTICSVS